MSLPAATPEIPVTDLHTALAYYTSALGFTLDWHAADIGLAGISHGACRLFLADSAFRKAHANSSPIVTWLNVNSRAEVDALHHAWSAAAARIVSPPESKPWNLHEFTAADPDGNLFRVFYDFTRDLR